MFKSKDNILIYQLEQAIQSQKPSKEKASQMTLYDICENYSRFVDDNYKQLKMLVDNNLTPLLNKKIVETMLSCRESYIHVSEEERDYAVHFMANGLCSLTQQYITLHDQIQVKELTQLAYKIMSGCIYRK